MPKREIGEFKFHGFLISAIVFLAIGGFIYSRFSFKTELPVQQQLSAQIQSLAQRIDQLGQRVESMQQRVEDLERKAPLGRPTRKPTRRGSGR